MGSVHAADMPKPVALAVAELKRETPVDFEKEILPLFKINCLACHNETKAKADLILETPATILKGGENGPAVVPGKSAGSLLFKAAAHLEKPFMPPKDNKVNAADFDPAQLALLKLWIDQGAKGEVHGTSPIVWLDKPPVLDPIFAVALTSDGQFAAAGRGNRIDIYHLPSSRFLTRLKDTNLSAGFTNAAHRDLVSALAFNPEGTLLASAGYREVKLWRHPQDVQKSTFTFTNGVARFAVSPNHQWFATAGPGNDIALRNADDGRVRIFSGHRETITDLKFSPDGSRFASCSKDGEVRLWNVADRGLFATVQSPAEPTSLAWIADGQKLAVGAEDGVIRVFEFRTDPKATEEQAPPKTGEPGNPVGTLVNELKGPAARVTALEALPGTNGLLSGGADGALRVWNVAGSKMVREFLQGAPVTAIAVRPDGKRFASAGTNRIVCFWDAAQGRLVSQLKGDRYANELVSKTERGLIVATSDLDFRSKLLETAEGQREKQAERLVKAAETNASTEKLFAEKRKSLDDSLAARGKAATELTNLLAGIDKTIRDFEAADRAAREAARQAKIAAARAADAQLSAERAGLARADTEKMAVEAAAVAEKTKAASNELPPEARGAAQKVADDAASVAQKARSLADAVTADAGAKKETAAENVSAAEKAIETVAALSFHAGELKPNYDKTLAEAPDRRKAATNQVDSAAKALAAAESDFKKAETRKSVTNHELELAQQSAQRAAATLVAARSQLADVELAKKQTETRLANLKQAAAAAEQNVRALAFSPDNRCLATAGDDMCVHTWNADSGAPFEVIRGHAAPVIALAFTTANTVLSVTEDQRAVAWDLEPGWQFERAIGSGDADSSLVDRVNALDFSPDGRVLATGSGEPTRSGEVKLWSVDEGKLLRSFGSMHSDAVLSVRFSPDGRHLASASADRFVRVVELTTGKVIQAFEGHTSYVLGVAWKCDSRTLASAGADKMIKVWDFVTGERKKNIEGAEKEVTSIAFVGASGDAVAASGDSQVRLIRESGEKIRSFEGAGEFINAVAVTPDGLIVVAGGQDGVMHVWNGANGQKLATFGPEP
jgi:WD40 repeat protein